MGKHLIFNNEEDITQYIENNSCYDVLGVFNSYINVIDRYENEGEEKTIRIDREINGHIILLESIK